jgi:hypothetical protein
MLALSSSGGALRAGLLRGTSVLVLVCTKDWGTPPAPLLDAIRAELRGLGATLLVVSDEALFYFRPDADSALVPGSPGFAPAAIDELIRAYGAASSEPAPSRLTLSVVEGEGSLRFRISRTITASVPATLLEALQLAGQSAIESAARGTFSRRESVVLSLPGAHHESPAPRARRAGVT